jgi:hypothetical protein
MLMEYSRSKVFLFFSSQEMQAVTSRFDLSPLKGRPISTMFCATIRRQLLLELEI